MSDEPISLAAARAHKTRDSRDWSVLDALRDAIADIESGRIKPDKIYIALAGPNDDGTMSYPHFAAGLSRLEAMGLLAMHMGDNT